MQNLTESNSILMGWKEEAVLYWHSYLWHHRHPKTRLLHQIGSWICLAGMSAFIVGFSWYIPVISIIIGYCFAFAGHYLIEKNRPLTLKHPVRAGICNWVLFFYEMFQDVDIKLKELEKQNPDTREMDSV